MKRELHLQPISDNCTCYSQVLLGFSWLEEKGESKRILWFLKNACWNLETLIFLPLISIWGACFWFKGRLDLINLILSNIDLYRVLRDTDRPEELDFLFLNVLFLTEYNAKQYSGTVCATADPAKERRGGSSSVHIILEARAACRRGSATRSWE